ncbi:antibiotic biosynthesis monooxygenase [Nodosilinea nodulosa]|uniref:antibiotic biosynthesis monooxygenase n=1 Tax=Nodosilinea nodulosa TaxID=416001 RepID=UPI0002E2507B|nr:antibiotic biosynthesis monooxygenase [Nodosilinea nodulosa]
MTPLSDAEGPVTVMISRRIKPDRKADFETWLAGITQAAHGFPGYLGANVIQPSSAAQPEFVTIFRFDSYSHLMQWENSSVRQRWLALADDMAESESQVQRLPGLEFWFTPRDRAAPPTPPRYKMAIVLTLVIFLLSLVFTPLVKVVLSGLPPLLAKLLGVAVQVVLLTYVILPRLTKLLARWLFATRAPKRPSR